MRCRIIRLIACVILASSYSFFIGSAAAEVRRETTERIIQDVYIPAYQEFYKTSDDLLNSINKLCTATHALKLNDVQQAFANAVAAFSVIEFYRVGPMLQNNRQNRLFYWPDKRRVGERQLRALLANSENLNSTTIAEKSVALQGFPAMQRLLFDESALGELTDPGTNSRCLVAKIVAGNIAQIASELHAQWADPAGVQQQMLQPQTTSEIFRTENEVLKSYLTQLSAGLEFMLVRKLEPLIVSFQPEENRADFKASIRKAPFWKSGSFLTNVRGNVVGLRALLLESGIAAETNLYNELEFEFRLALSHIDKLEATTMLESDGRTIAQDAQGLLLALAIPLASIHATIGDRISSALGVSAGFNSDDGD